jgi:uncharacterized RDD family membrane protein YckC
MQHQIPDFSELDDLTEENLDFSALSDGLGFHGESKKRQAAPSPATIPTSTTTAPKMGTGATVAGPVRFATSTNTANMKPALQTATQTHAQKETRSEKAPWLRAGANPAHRLAAFATDLFFVTFPLYLACRFSFTKAQFLSLLHTDGKIFVALYLAVLSVYFLLSESFGGQSLGKIIWKLQVVEDDKYEKPIGFIVALFRLITLALGILPLGLGLLSTFQDSKFRSWHDKLTRSIVRSKI